MRRFLFILLSLTFLLSSHLGYGMSGDLKCLLATWHQFLEEPLKMEGMLDLLSIHQKVILSGHETLYELLLNEIPQLQLKQKRHY